MTPQMLFTDDLAPSCILSADGGGKDGLGSYRYTLRIPIAGSGRGTCLFIMANPSTAVVVDGQFNSDPTVTRCLGYARRWGYGALIVENVRAWRETDPKLVPADPLAIGPENDLRIQRSAVAAELIVCGWGSLGGSRGIEVLRALAPLRPHALKLNADGAPSHPLYLAGDLRPVPMVIT